MEYDHDESLGLEEFDIYSHKNKYTKYNIHLYRD